MRRKYKDKNVLRFSISYKINLCTLGFEEVNEKNFYKK